MTILILMPGFQTSSKQEKKMTDFQEISEVSASLEDIYMQGRVDINFFASLCIPEVCIYDLQISTVPVSSFDE